MRVDDAWGVRLARQARVPVTTFGSGPDADVRLTRVRTSLAGTTLHLSGADGAVDLEVPLLSRVNGVNAAADYLAARALGLSREQARDGLACAAPPPGRHSLVVGDEAPLVVVDFAHTPAALTALIDTGRELAAPGGRVVLVFGGRGERDRVAVLAENRLGLLGRDVPLVVEPDRCAALQLAVHAGRPGDVVFVAGRGAETLLHSSGRTERFVDREVVDDLLGVAGIYRPAA